MKAGPWIRRTATVTCLAMLLVAQACGDSGDSHGQSGGQGGTGTGGSTSSGGNGPSGGATGSGGESVGNGGIPATNGGSAAGGSAGTVAGGTGAGGTSAGGAAGTTDAGADLGSIDTSPTDAGPASVRLAGRFDLTDKTKPSFGWSGSAIFARFNGTGATLRIDGSPNQFQVVLDGAPTSVLKVVSGTTQYTVASGLSAGTHEIIIWKRTEGNLGSNRFLGLDVTGGQLLAASPAPDRRIEIFGDSITAGYGLDGAGPSCAASADNENHYLTYGAIAARTLNAELHAIAWSGIGMYRNYGQSAASADAMPAVYARTLADQSGSVWDFSTWLPHVVVINLGTNDSNAGDPGIPFETAYLNFVRTLRQKYPDTFFVLAVGPMLSGDSLTAIRTHVQNVIKTRASEGDSKMSYLEFPTQLQSDGLGCDWHPGPKTNSLMATQLVAELKKRLAW